MHDIINVNERKAERTNMTCSGTCCTDADWLASTAAKAVLLSLIGRKHEADLATQGNMHTPTYDEAYETTMLLSLHGQSMYIADS